MPTLIEPARAGRTARTRLLMLPAAYAEPAEFVEHGFVRAVRERSLELDLVFAGFELEELSDRSVFARLREEILRPARALGCEVWVGGISLGGFLAPYLGSHLVTSEIERANGLESWRPAELCDDDDEQRVWRFIRTLRGGSLPVHLGLGREDRFGRRHALMAAALAPGSVDVVPGGHDWHTWRVLWERFLDARLAPKPGRDPGIA